MTKLGIISAAALASTVALASPVFADWTELGEDLDGNTFYIEYDTLKENNGLIYYWRLQDYLKPEESGYLSSKVLTEVDCDTPRKYRSLSYVFYKQPMAGGNGDTYSRASEWRDPMPDGGSEVTINKVCDYAWK